MTGNTNSVVATAVIDDKIIEDIVKLLDNQTKKILANSTPIDTLVTKLVNEKLNSGSITLDKLIENKIKEKINSGEIALNTMIENASRIYTTKRFGVISLTPSGNRQNKSAWVRNTFNGKGQITLFINNKATDETLPSIYHLSIDGASAEGVLNEGESSIDKIFAQTSGVITFTFDSSIELVIPDSNNVSYLLETV